MPYPRTPNNHLLKDLYKEIIIGNPEQLGSLVQVRSNKPAHLFQSFAVGPITFELRAWSQMAPDILGRV